MLKLRHNFSVLYVYYKQILVSYVCLHFQVGLLGMARSFQRELDRIAESADTSTPEGLNYVLQGKTVPSTFTILMLRIWTLTLLQLLFEKFLHVL